MIKTIKRLRKKLIKNYNTGRISYPRVSNDYLDKTSFFLSPHVPIEAFDEHSLPLVKSSYPLNKKSSILELTNAEILTPSTIENVFEVIDIFFDDDLNVKMEMKEKLDGLLEYFETYLENKGKGININDLCKDGKVSGIPLRMSMYTINHSPDYLNTSQKKRKYSSKKERASNFIKEENLNLIKKSSLHEAMISFHGKGKEKNSLNSKVNKSPATLKDIGEYSLKI